MAKSEGKKFEEDFKDSIPEQFWFNRYKDGTANFGGSKNENVRFQAHNIADCEVMGNRYLFIIELKSHKGASIPFNCIRETQLKEMATINHKLIKPYFIFNFRDFESTFAVKAQIVKGYIEMADRKSFPIKWVQENGTEIIETKKISRYRYDVEKFINNIEKIGVIFNE